MTFRKLMTALAAVALVAFAVAIAQAGDTGNPYPATKAAMDGSSCMHQMKGPGCGHGQMAADCCKMMKGPGCGHGQMAADCCRMMKGAGPGAVCPMHGEKCDRGCMSGMRREVRVMCVVDDECCNWSCDGIWGDYDCSNPGGKSLLNCRKHKDPHTMIYCNDDDVMMMREETRCGECGRKIIRIEQRGRGDGARMEHRARMMERQRDASCRPDCKWIQKGTPGCQGMTPPPAPVPPPEGCPHSGK